MELAEIANEGDEMFLMTQDKKKLIDTTGQLIIRTTDDNRIICEGFNNSAYVVCGSYDSAEKAKNEMMRLFSANGSEDNYCFAKNEDTKSWTI